MLKSTSFLIRVKSIAMVLAAVLAAPAFGQSPDQRVPLQQFVAQTFFHGVPYEEVLSYGPAAVPELIDVLRDPSREPLWANAAIMLAMLGDPRGIEAVLAFVREPGPGPLTPYRDWARGNAVLALGYAASEGRNRQALQYLVEGLQPGTWAGRGVRGAQGRPPPHAAEVEAEEEADPSLGVDEWLTNQAAVGLALSGTPEARRALEQFRGAPGQLPRQREKIDNLLQEHQRIAQQGLRQYDNELRRRTGAPPARSETPPGSPPGAPPGAGPAAPPAGSQSG